jgi:hypothetical protein
MQICSREGCRMPYFPRDNVGRWQCRLHTDIIVPGTKFFRCCGARVDEFDYAYRQAEKYSVPHSTYLDILGCYHADHDINPQPTGHPGYAGGLEWISFARVWTDEAKGALPAAILGYADTKPGLEALLRSVNIDSRLLTKIDDIVENIIQTSLLEPAYYTDFLLSANGTLPSLGGICYGWIQAFDAISRSISILTSTPKDQFTKAHLDQLIIALGRFHTRQASEQDTIGAIAEAMFILSPYPKAKEILENKARGLANALSRQEGKYFSIVAIRRVSPVISAGTTSRARQMNWTIGHTWPT